jgi:hypothetical protein
VIVQAARGCAVEPAAVTLVDPQLQLAPGEPPMIRVEGRPGDRLRLFAATALRDEPQWSVRGASRLAGSKPFPEDVLLDEAGRAELRVPPLPTGKVLVQMLVAPRGGANLDGPGARWTGVVDLTPR